MGAGGMEEREEDRQQEQEQPDVFDISNKERDPQALLKWRQATLVLNASRRFRYTAKVQGREDGGPSSPLARAASQKMTPAQRFRKSGHTVMAVKRFEQAGKERKLRLADMGDGFGLTAEQLVELNSEASLDHLRDLGGVGQVCRALRVDPQQGISTQEEEVEKRRQEFGTNTYPAPPAKSWLMFAWEAAQDKTLIILMVCAIISLGAGIATDPDQGWYEGVAIAAAVIIVILFTATSDYIQSLQFRGLNAEKQNIQLNVLRDGRMHPVSIFFLLVGDIVPLSIGDQVPADGLVVTSHSLTIDESSMTGESDPIHKGPEHPFLMAGCKVVDGVGSMLVTAVGMNTEWGKVMATVNDDEESETPLQVRLNGLATGIGKLGLAVAGLVLVVLIIYYAVRYVPGKPASTVVKDITSIIIISITIIVVAVPEGLPLAVTLTLAFSMRKMMNDKALVRRLSACETMGCATTICSDKTGTLTLNQMTATREFWGAELHDSDSGKAPGGRLWELLCENITQNGQGTVFITEDGSPEVTASPTEAAVISWALKLGLDFNAVRAAGEVVGLETFNSSKKRGGAVVKKASGELRAQWKGAAEIVVGLCTQWMSASGHVEPLTPDMGAKIAEAISSMAAGSLRCIALAFRDVSPREKASKGDAEWQVPENDLVLLAIVGIKDPCRPGVPDAVSRCQMAGVKVRMVTGDNQLTARAIAGECGILTPEGIVIEGKDFRVLSREEMLATIPRIDVMARSSPSDKHLLVRTLRQMGEVVAVTGDGTNDAPALKEADIGLSMGISGTEVAKESSDIVILDDNFTSIVKVVRWGRAVFANIQKFVQFQLTVNIGALLIDFIVALSGNTNDNGAPDIPLTAVQLLWINLIMDTLAALALATEPPTDELLEHKPVGRRAPLITNIMWRNIILMSIYQVTVLLVLFFDGMNLLGLPNDAHGYETRNTVIFNAFVWCQIFNEFNCRKPDKFNVFSGLLSNPLFIGVIVVSIAFQVLLVQLPALNAFANTVGLSWQLWLFCIIVGLISIPLAALFKLVPVPRTPFMTLLLPKKWFRRKGLARDQSTTQRESEVTATPEVREPLDPGAAPAGQASNGDLPDGQAPDGHKSNGVDGLELPRR